MAAAAAGAPGTPLGGRAQAARASARTGVAAIDIHAHYYPQGYFDVMNAEGGRFNAHFETDGRTFSFKTPAASNGGLPMKFID
jgi:aminocarboxymuconate-semialdehyde decarboxylase